MQSRWCCLRFLEQIIFHHQFKEQKSKKNKVSAHIQIYQKQKHMQVHTDGKAHEKTSSPGWGGELEPMPAFAFSQSTYLLDGFSVFEFTCLDCHRREVGCFLPLEATGGRIKCLAEQFTPVGKFPPSFCLGEEEETGHWLTSMFK